MIEVGEFREDMPLSELIQLAVNDARKAVATGGYVLDGDYWHVPFSGGCRICLGGGIIAGLVRFNSKTHITDDCVGFAVEGGAPIDGWQEESVRALDDVREGEIIRALRRLDQLDGADTSAARCAGVLIAESFDNGSSIAPLETYEAAAQILAEVGL